MPFYPYVIEVGKDMKVAWVYPQNHKCGIATYSKRYTDALQACGLQIIHVRWNRDTPDIKTVSKIINGCDLVHIQYEQSIFLKNRKELFAPLCALISRPIVVSLHEIYRQFPGVFPKENITGPFLLLKKAVYDFRHPAVTAFSRVVKKNFFSDLVLVHHHYHKEILLQNGTDEKLVEVLPHPVSCNPDISYSAKKFDKRIELGCAGFINPQYDYALLFNALSGLKIDWKFTWIGGLRESRHREVLQKIFEDIKTRGWEKKIIITGWLKKEAFRERIQNLDIALCLFSHRSSSETIGDLLSAGVTVVATDIEMTREIEEAYSAIQLCSFDPHSVSQTVTKICSDSQLREQFSRGAKKYCEQNSYCTMAEKMKGTYERILCV